MKGRRPPDVASHVISEVAPHIKAGRLRALAVTSAQRWPSLPDAPTFAELGYKDIVITEWLGWLMPAKTPADVVLRLNSALRDAMAGPERVEVVNKLGLRARTASPGDFATMVKADLERWAAGPGRCTWTLRKICWLPRLAGPMTGLICRPAATARC